VHVVALLHFTQVDVGEHKEHVVILFIVFT